MPDTANKGISATNFLGKESSTGKLARIVRSNKKAISINARKITSLKNIAKENQKQDAGDTIGDKLPGSSGGGIAKILGDIADNMDSIKNTIIDQQNLDKKSAEKDRIDAEKGERTKKEKDLESKFSGIKKIGSKVLGPVKSLWEKLLNFITTIFLGRVAMKLFDWFSDPKNTEKIAAIGRFLKDWWPALLTGYLLFGNALGRFITGLGIKLIGWGVTLLKTVIPALMKAAAAMGPWGVGVLALGAGAVYMSTRKKKTDQNVDASIAESGGEETANTLREEQAEKEENQNPLKRFITGTVMGEDAERSQQIQTAETGNKPSFGFFGQRKPEEMNKGGTVPGSGNTDTVPAMLTPGEFVMSKGAVEKFGTDTLAGMNAAAGGTNRPTLMGGFNEGGNVQTMSEKLGHTRGTVTDPKEKAQQESYMLKFVNEERALQGLEPLNDLTYAPGVELTKMMGPGPKTTETSDTDMNFETGMKSTWKTKSRGNETIFQGSTEMITQEDRDKFFAANPHARMMLQLKDQAELDALGADISASAKMNGGGLVLGFQGGGQVRRMGRSASNRRMKLAKSTPNIKKINPRPKKTTSTVAYDQAMKDQAKAQLPNQQTRQDLPKINAGAMISQSKIKTLGITI